MLRLGDLSAHRDFVDVRDVARAAVLARRPRPARCRRVLNIGSGRAVRSATWCTAGDVAGFRGRIEEGGAGSARSAAVAWQCADIAAAGQALGWQPRPRSTDSLDDAVGSAAPAGTRTGDAREPARAPLRPSRPGPGAWQAARRRRTALYGVVLNAANGPGDGPDPRVHRRRRGAAGGRGAACSGTSTPTTGGAPPAEIADDVARHREWYAADGCFLDQVAGRPPAGLLGYRRLARTARPRGAGTVVLNPGVHPAPGYARLADLLVTFEGHWYDLPCRRSAPRRGPRGIRPSASATSSTACPAGCAASAPRATGGAARSEPYHCAGDAARPARTPGRRSAARALGRRS